MDHGKLAIVLIGVGGYGTLYVRELLNNRQDPDLILAGAVDPFAESSPLYPDLIAARIPVYRSVEAFYAQSAADLAVISSPIQHHAGQMTYCLEHSSHVLCEKPVCARIDDVSRLIQVRDQTAKQVAIGYQWSHSQAILDLKSDILQGRFGRCRRMKSIVLWPRNLAYYARGSGWAGKKKSADGLWVLDSVAANATAHYLHNMLFLAGKSIDRSAEVKSITAETYRANAIETFDTCALRIRTADEAQILFLASHAIASVKKLDPSFELEYESGQVYTKLAADGKNRIYARMNDGTTLDYGSPDDDTSRKLHWMIDVIRGQRKVVCGLEAAAVHTLCISAIEELIPETPVFPKELIRFDETSQLIYCEGLDSWLSTCYGQWKLLSEAGVGWALPAQDKIIIQTGANTPFPLRKAP